MTSGQQHVTWDVTYRPHVSSRPQTLNPTQCNEVSTGFLDQPQPVQIRRCLTGICKLCELASQLWSDVCLGLRSLATASA